MTVSEFIFEYLHRRGVEVGFTVTGGGAMFLNEAHRKSEIQSFHNHHEQACAMAAVGYTKASDKPSLVVTTTGCGVTNAMTGLLDAYQDSVPVFFLSGNVNKSQMTYFNGSYGMRKWGVQESNTMSIVSGITKDAKVIADPYDVGATVDLLFNTMVDGRTGPVWLDVPLDIQNAPLLDEYCDWWFNYLESSKDTNTSVEINKDTFSKLHMALDNAKRPLFLIGNGARPYIKQLARLNIPMVFTYLSADLLPSSDPLNVGRVGVKGDRAGNFAVQNCDVLVSIGSSLTTAVTGYDLSTWAANSELFVIDLEIGQHRHLIDAGKLKRANALILNTEHLVRYFQYQPKFQSTEWHNTVARWKTAWDINNESHTISTDDSVNIYSFLDDLSKNFGKERNRIIVSDAGSAYYTTSQAFKFASGDRYVTSGAQADMGFTLPAAIGASIANPDACVFAITGDGSLQMNIQELQTLSYLKPNVKLFVLNNNGYLSIRNTMDKFFDSNYIGTDSSSGISFPNLQRIAGAYNIPYLRYDKTSQSIDAALDTVGPVIIEVMCIPNQLIIPTLASKKNDDGTVTSQPLHNMFPFLSDHELITEMQGDK